MGVFCAVKREDWSQDDAKRDAIPQRPSQLRRTIEKKMLFYFQKLEFSPSNPNSGKSLQVLRFSHDLIAIIYQKIEKGSQKKYFLIKFTSNHPIATQIPDLNNG